MVAQVTNGVSEQEWLSPLPEPTDSQDVNIAIRAARALETRGELAEAARWLRRAANLVEREGDDARAFALGRAAADLTSAVESRAASVAPPASSAAPRLVDAPPAHSQEVPMRNAIQPPKPRQPAWLATLTLLPDTGADRAASSTPPPPRALPTTKPPPTPSVKPPAMPASVKPPVVPNSTKRLAMPASAPPPVAATAPVRVSSAPPRPEPKAGASEAPPPAKPASSDFPADISGAIRVAFRASERHANLIVVRRLQAGESLPPGSSEALLVLPPGSSEAAQGRKA